MNGSHFCSRVITIEQNGIQEHKTAAARYKSLVHNHSEITATETLLEAVDGKTKLSTSSTL